jgi:hypothetical protein
LSPHLGIAGFGTLQNYAKERQGRYFALGSIVMKFITSYFSAFFQRKTFGFSVFSEKSAQIQRKL